MVRKDIPQPPTNPPEPEYHHEEHDFREPDKDIEDGPSRSEVEKVEFTPFIVLHKEYECKRDGCHATMTKRVLFAMEDVMDEWSERDVEQVNMNMKRVDINTLEVERPSDGEIIEVEPREYLVTDKPSGACNGSPGRTSPL